CIAGEEVGKCLVLVDRGGLSGGCRRRNDGRVERVSDESERSLVIAAQGVVLCLLVVVVRKTRDQCVVAEELGDVSKCLVVHAVIGINGAAAQRRHARDAEGGNQIDRARIGERYLDVRRRGGQ